MASVSPGNIWMSACSKSISILRSQSFYILHPELSKPTEWGTWNKKLGRNNSSPFQRPDKMHIHLTTPQGQQHEWIPTMSPTILSLTYQCAFNRERIFAPDRISIRLFLFSSRSMLSFLIPLFFLGGGDAFQARKSVRSSPYRPLHYHPCRHFKNSQSGSKSLKTKDTH